MSRSAQYNDVNFEVGLREPVEEIHATNVDFPAASNDLPLALRPPATSGSAVVPIIREWSERTYSTARQYLGERLGLRTRSSLSELDQQVVQLHRTREEYACMLALTKQLAAHVGGMVTAQLRLSGCFSELTRASGPSPCPLGEDYACHESTLEVLAKNGQRLLDDLNRFVSSLNTLCNTAMADTMETVGLYEAARLAYDARRNEYEALCALPQSSSIIGRLEEAKATYEAHRLKYEDKCSTLSAKLKFLDENRVKVMRRDLILLHNATAAYFAGNKVDLESKLSQFSMGFHRPLVDRQSWLEN